MPFLIVGLGNPGDEYAETRHNFGFRVVDELVAKISAAKEKTRAKAQAWSGKMDKMVVHIIEPQTFMNLSGEAIVPFMKSKKIAADSLVVVHDDLDIPFGEIRVSRNVSAAGHNGVQSIIDSLGTQDFTRVRLGIGRPPENMPADRFVLQRFTAEEKKKLPEIIEKAISEIEKIFSR
jgi:peptidyl-tRNA hydrolase, PTH1 family